MKALTRRKGQVISVSPGNGISPGGDSPEYEKHSKLWYAAYDFLDGNFRKFAETFRKSEKRISGPAGRNLTASQIAVFSPVCADFSVLTEDEARLVDTLLVLGSTGKLDPDLMSVCEESGFFRVSRPVTMVAQEKLTSMTGSIRWMACLDEDDGCYFSLSFVFPDGHECPAYAYEGDGIPAALRISEPERQWSTNAGQSYMKVAKDFMVFPGTVDGLRRMTWKESVDAAESVSLEIGANVLHGTLPLNQELNLVADRKSMVKSAFGMAGWQWPDIDFTGIGSLDCPWGQKYGPFTIFRTRKG